jgi:hypothetical protein
VEQAQQPPACPSGPFQYRAGVASRILYSNVNGQGLPMPPRPVNLAEAALHDYALQMARYGHGDADIQAAIGGGEGVAVLAALAEGGWLERERMRGLGDLAQLLHLSAAADPQVLKFLAKARLRWSDEVAPQAPPPTSIVISIPGLTTQDPTL